MLGLFKEKFTISNSKKRAKASFMLDIEKGLKRIIKEKFSSVLKLYIFDTGSCNGCELELQLLFSPLHNLASVGIEVVYNASEADIVCLTGLMTQNISLELEQVVDALKEPKHIVTIGDCTLFCTSFKNNFALMEKEEKSFFTPSFHIAGCPPEPQDLVEGLYMYLKMV